MKHFVIKQPADEKQRKMRTSGTYVPTSGYPPGYPPPINQTYTTNPATLSNSVYGVPYSQTPLSSPYNPNPYVPYPTTTTLPPPSLTYLPPAFTNPTTSTTKWVSPSYGNGP